MTIKHVRIDDRLIHGQVGMAWIQNLKADTVFVINDATANNDMVAKMVPMGAPSGIAVKVLTVADATEMLQEEEWNDKKILIICKYPEDVLGLLENGIELPQVNLGNMSGKKGEKYKIGRGIWIWKEQIPTYEKIAEYDVDMTAKMLPDDRTSDLEKELEKFKKKIG